MGKRIRWLLITALGVLTPSFAQAQATDVFPAVFTGFLSHPRYDAGGFYVGVDFLFLQGPSGASPDSILSLGYRTEDGTVYQFSWWSQWFNPVNLNGLAFQGTKLEIIDFTFRLKAYETDCFRSFTTLGPRLILYSQDLTDPVFGFTNYNVDNNQIGFFIGSINEWYLGSNPLGAFSFTLEGEAGLYVDEVRQVAGAGQFGSVATTSFSLTGSLQGKLGFIWYPWEAISIHAGVDVLWLLNEQAGHQPQFLAGAVSAQLTSVWPWYAGLYLGFGFVF